jgi:hypothetical protein
MNNFRAAVVSLDRDDIKWCLTQSFGWAEAEATAYVEALTDDDVKNRAQETAEMLDISDMYSDALVEALEVYGVKEHEL